MYTGENSHQTGEKSLKLHKTHETTWAQKCSFSHKNILFKKSNTAKITETERK